MARIEKVAAQDEFIEKLVAVNRGAQSMIGRPDAGARGGGLATSL